MTDNELLKRFTQHNDHDALTELIERHSSMVLRLAGRMMRNSTDAEDAFQATFLLLVRKASSIQKHPSLAGWLYQSSYRICLRMRDRKFSAREKTNRKDLKEMSNANEPWMSISNDDMLGKLNDALGELPPKYREAILLCHIEGMSRNEAAERMKVTMPSIKAALSRGLKMLRCRLLKKGIALSAAIALVAKTTAATAATSAAGVATVSAAAGSSIASGAGTAVVTNELIAQTVQACTCQSGSGLAASGALTQLLNQGTSMFSSSVYASISAIAVTAICVVAAGAALPDTSSEKIPVVELDSTFADETNEVQDTGPVIIDGPAEQEDVEQQVVEQDLLTPAEPAPVVAGFQQPMFVAPQPMGANGVVEVVDGFMMDGNMSEYFAQEQEAKLQELTGRLKCEIIEIKRTCNPDEEQLRKLEVASARTIAETEEKQAEFLENIKEDPNTFFMEMQSSPSMESWTESMARTLTDDQRTKLQAAQEANQQRARKIAIDELVMRFGGFLRLDEKQSQQIAEILDQKIGDQVSSYLARNAGYGLPETGSPHMGAVAMGIPGGVMGEPAAPSATISGESLSDILDAGQIEVWDSMIAHRLTMLEAIMDER